MVSRSAARQAARILAAPAVKLIMAGTRPADITASKVTTPPFDVGSMTPSERPSSASGISFSAEHRAGLQQPLIGHLAADRILDRQPVRTMDFRRVDQRFDHGAVGRGGPEDQVGHDRIKRGSGGLPPLAALELRIDIKLDRFKHCDGDFRKPAAAHLRALEPAEDRRLRPVDAHRHHHGVRLVGDQAGAVIDLHQAAGDGDAAFREDHQGVAVAHRIDDVAHRKRLERIERHGAHDLEHRLDPPTLRNPHVDGEDRPLRQHRRRQRRIEKADVIERDDGSGTGLVDVLQAFDLEPEEGAEHHGEEIVHPARRHGAADDDGDDQSSSAEQHEAHRHA